MAYSKIEQAYVDSLVQAQFPDPVEPEPTLLASADTGITTDGGAYVGTRLNMPKGLNTPENMQAVGNDIPKTVAGVAKGMAQGFVGLPGDLEGIGRLVLNYMGADVNEQTKLPTTQDVKGFLDQYIKLPELQTGDMSNFETAGEWLAPGGQIKAIKPVAKAIKGAVKMTEGLPVGLSTKAVGEGVDDLGFYSAAAKAVDAIQQPKGTGEQFLAQITKTPGVKQDEIMWTGLDDFLKSKKTVTKQEVQDYLANNRVEIKEVSLADGGLKKKFSVDSPEDQDFYDVIDKQGKVIFTGPEDEADYLLDRSLTKYSKYTLPGGENYREVLLTLPSREQGAYILGSKDGDKVLQQFKNYDEAFSFYQSQPQSDRLATYIKPKNSNPEFKSNHFDQPNILAHLRVDDRIDAEGKKVLMVEEVQSDWHQAGRKKGYQVKQTPQDLEIRKTENGYGVFDKNRNNLISEHLTEEKAIDRMGRVLEEHPTTTTGVPDAPFKTTWQELAMKRAIQMAAEGGYDRIAFTTGKTQAARFDLSKQIDSIEYFPESQSFVALKGGKPVISEKATPENLADYIGKDAASKLLEQPKVKAKRIGETVMQELSGQDLQVGGEGMKGFYDNILPKFLDKYAKKWDAKTGMTKIRLETDAQAVEDAQLLRELGVESDGKSSASVHYIDITPKMRESVVTKGQPMFAIGAGGAGAATQQNQEKK